VRDPRDGSRLVRRVKREAGFAQPAQIRRARIGKERLAWREPTPHPSRADLGIGPEAKRDHEHHGEACQGAAGPARTLLEVTQRGADGSRVQADHEECAVGHLARELDHAGARRQQIHRRRLGGAVPEAGRRRTEPDLLSGEQPAQIANRLPHESQAGARLPDAPR
jgi:hypothetical protein